MDKNLSLVSKDAIIGEGTQIEEFVAIKGNTTIGNKGLIRSHTVIYPGNKIGNNFKTGHGVLIRENNTIGENVSIGSHTVLEHDVTIGNNCRVHSGAFIPEFTVIEEGAWVGPAVVITNAKYPNSPAAKNKLKGVRIKMNAKIGAGAVILPGVIIGRNALVGAGAVVVEDVLDGEVVVGNPARVVKKISEIKDYE